MAGVSEKLCRIISNLDIPVHFKSKNKLRQRLFHTKGKNTQTQIEWCRVCSADLYIGEMKQQLHKNMAQHRRASSSGPDSAVHLHLKEKGHSEDSNVHVLHREDRWFERGSHLCQTGKTIFEQRRWPQVSPSQHLPRSIVKAPVWLLRWLARVVLMMSRCRAGHI